MSNFGLDIKKERLTDEWYTPAEYVRVIVPFLREAGFHKILCPFDTKDSAFVSVLTDEGFEVTYGHIWDGEDFFARTDLHKYDAVVSNPPFSRRQDILDRLFGLQIPFALIMNINGIFDAKCRWRLFKDNPFEFVIPDARMRFINDAIEPKHPNFQSIWVCSRILPRQFEFVELPKWQR